MIEQKTGHVPVLLNEVMQALKPEEDKTYIDATFGNGGYSEKILTMSNCKVIAIDQDPQVLAKADYLKSKYGKRFRFFKKKFSELEDLLTSLDIDKVDGFVFDIGVSSMQIDNERRGFSFKKNGLLDMRMSQDGMTAEELINTAEQEELADIIYQYGDETKSRNIAKKIVNYRTDKKIVGTIELADIISSCFPKKYYKKHPATKTFQALRIFLNNEIQELISGLNIASKFLADQGKLCMVTFHSIEDRIVKNFFKITSSKNYIKEGNEKNSLFISNCKAIKPLNEEVKFNRRARSAKLRFGLRNSNKHIFISTAELGFY